MPEVVETPKATTAKKLNIKILGGGKSTPTLPVIDDNHPDKKYERALKAAKTDAEKAKAFD